MLSTIDLNDYFGLETDKIWNITIDRVLASKLVAANLAITYPVPEKFFCFGRVVSQSKEMLLLNHPLTLALSRHSLRSRGRGNFYLALHHPTLPSSEIATSFCASTANSIGRC